MSTPQPLARFMEMPAVLGLPDEARLPGRGYQPVDLLVLAFFSIVLLLLIVTPNPVPDQMALIIAHGGFLAGVAFLRRVEREPRLVARFLRDWYFFLALPLFYGSLRYLNRTVSLSYYDDLIMRIEQTLFASQPSQILHAYLPWAPISEFLHLTYLLYLALVPLVGLTLYLRGRLGAYRLFATTILATYFFCYLCFIFLPVRGPFHEFGALPLNDGLHFFARLSHRLLDNASSAGTAFPSSHVAVAVAIWLVTRRYFRLLSWIVLIIAVGIFVGTVYGGFHYAIDAFAGAAVGTAFGLLGPRFHRALTRTLARRLRDSEMLAVD